MRIRSITCFSGLDPRHDDEALDRCGGFLAEARARFQDGGFEVQTVRLALSPIGKLCEEHEAVEFARALEDACAERGIDYATVGPIRPMEGAAFWERIPEMLGATERIFCAGRLDTPHGVSLEAVRRCAKVIVENAQLSDDGFGNLRFAALSRVGPGVPFLPAAYHGSGSEQFAIATESADVAVQAFAAADKLRDARTEFVSRMQEEGDRLVDIAERLDPRFSGIDFSLAPHPDRARSIGAALESLGLQTFGRSGSVALAAFLTSCLDEVALPRAGFCGLFLPVLEDAVLSERAAAGALGFSELLLLSTVCGTGLDTIPLPGNVQLEALEPVLTDLAALAVRHGKPLTARLMPMPGRKAGDALEFDFPYFSSGRVLALDATPFRGSAARSRLLPVDERSDPNAEA